LQEFSLIGPVRILRGQNYGPAAEEDDCAHGTGVAAQAVGKNLGLAPGADLVFVNQGTNGAPGQLLLEKILEALLLILDDIVAQNLGGKAVVNMSFGINILSVTPQFAQIMGTSYSSPAICHDPVPSPSYSSPSPPPPPRGLRPRAGTHIPYGQYLGPRRLNPLRGGIVGLTRFVWQSRSCGA
jgi:hypothetical protein